MCEAEYLAVRWRWVEFQIYFISNLAVHYTKWGVIRETSAYPFSINTFLDNIDAGLKI